MSLDILVLGCGSARPLPGRHPSAHLLRTASHAYLIDCGEGTQDRLALANISPHAIVAIFITHMHGDHCLGLLPLISSMQLTRRSEPLTVYAHGSFRDLFEQSVRFFVGETLTFPIEYRSIDPNHCGEIYNDQHISVRTVPLQHRVETVGFIFRERELPYNARRHAIAEYGLSVGEIRQLKAGDNVLRLEALGLRLDNLVAPPRQPASYAYISDTAYIPELVEDIRNVDLLYHEATFMHSEVEVAHLTSHSTATEAATLAKEANIGKLLLGHFSARYRSLHPLLDEARAIFPNAYLAYEGDVHRVAWLRAKSD